MSRLHAFFATLVAFAMFLSIFLPQPARAATDGSLTAPYSATGVDYDNPPDGQFDEVFANVGVTTASGGQFLVLVGLGGLGVGSLAVILEPGVTRLEIPVSAQLLRNAGDGPYALGLILETYPGSVFLGSDSLSTPAWHATDFEGPDVEIGGSIRNWPVDSTVPPNGLYDYLEIEVPVLAFEPAMYSVRLLYGGRLIVERIAALAFGNNSVRLDITANQIRTSGSPNGFGCLDVDVERVGGVGASARCSVIPGGNATVSKYEPTGAYISGAITDEGVDTDRSPDGRFDALAVRLPITVNRSGDYGIFGLMRAPNGTFVGSGSRTTFLSQGAVTFEVLFSHVGIVQNRVNGTFEIEFTLFDDRNTQLERIREVTSTYSWMSFDSLATGAVGAIQDRYVDTDSPPDGMLDEYRAQIPITIGAAGTYRVMGSIDFANWQTPHGAVQLIQSRVVELKPGTTTVELAWPIGDFTSRTVTPDLAFAAFYSVSRFDGEFIFNSVFVPSSPPAGAVLAGADLTMLGTPAVVFPDADKDGRFDDLAYDVNLSVNRQGPYAFHAYLTGVPGHNYPMSFFGSHIVLASGLQRIRLIFPGWAINASGIDGPYTVNLWYGRKDRESVPSEALWGLNSVFWHTPILSHWQFDGDRTVLDSWTLRMPPVVDGRIEGGEWANAETIDLKAADPGGLSANLSVTHDTDFVYLALDVTGDRTNDPLDSASFAFDVGEVGLPTLYFDAQISVGGLYGAPVGEMSCSGPTNPFGLRGICQSPFDTSSPDRVGLAATRGFGSSGGEVADHRMFEFRIPLRLLHIQPGAIIGIAVQLIYDESGSAVAWPVNSAGLNWVPPYNYARLTLEMTPPRYGGGPSGSLIEVALVALAIGLVAIATIVIFWTRRQRRHPGP